MSGHRVKIAQQGWASTEAARSVEETQTGIGVWWVEIDGHRFDHVLKAKVSMSEDEFAQHTLTLELFGPVELVYVDKDGNELPDRLLNETPELECGTMMDKEEHYHDPFPRINGVLCDGCGVRYNEKYGGVVRSKDGAVFCSRVCADKHPNAVASHGRV